MLCKYFIKQITKEAEAQATAYTLPLRKDAYRFSYEKYSYVCLRTVKYLKDRIPFIERMMDWLPFIDNFGMFIHNVVNRVYTATIERDSNVRIRRRTLR